MASSCRPSPSKHGCGRNRAQRLWLMVEPSAKADSRDGRGCPTRWRKGAPGRADPAPAAVADAAPGAVAVAARAAVAEIVMEPSAKPARAVTEAVPERGRSGTLGRRRANAHGCGRPRAAGWVVAGAVEAIQTAVTDAVPVRGGGAARGRRRPRLRPLRCGARRRRGNPRAAWLKSSWGRGEAACSGHRGGPERVAEAARQAIAERTPRGRGQPRAALGWSGRGPSAKQYRRP